MHRKPTSRRLLGRARHMRGEDTPAEKMAWVLLRNRQAFGLKFHRQVPIDSYIVDFYCHEFRLIIEIDGVVHDEPAQMEIDARRTERLTELHYRVLRVTNEIVLRSPDAFLQMIQDCLAREAPQHPSPSGRGRREAPGEGFQ